jgi:hypothetical protein
MHRSTLPLFLAATAVAAAVSGLPAAAAHGSGHHEDFRAELAPINHDGEGKVDLRQFKDHTIRVKLEAKGLDDGIHIAHIHGIRQAMNECPDHTFDTDHNGFVDILEGLPAYGPVQITLSMGLNDTGSELKYRRTFTTLDNGDDIAALGDLDQYAIVIHGVDLNGDGVANNPNAGGDSTTDPDDNEISMPALCGTIEDH